jgi:predicted transcriptional regulator
MPKKVIFDDLNIGDIHIRRLFYWLFFASKGGKTRFRIVKELLNSPMNKNELSKHLTLNYRTVEHHIKMLVENNIVEGDERKYDSIFYIKENIKIFIGEIVEKYDSDKEGGI